LRKLVLRIIARLDYPHSATGRFYGPAVYRRLLGAYAEYRRPSTSTLAAEKTALAAETTQVESVPETGVRLAIPSALPALIADARSPRRWPRVAAWTAPPRPKLPFYADRLCETELELRTERANAAHLQAALSQSLQRPVVQEQEVEKLRGIVAAQSEAISKLTAEVSDLRNSRWWPSTTPAARHRHGRSEPPIWKDSVCSTAGCWRRPARRRIAAALIFPICSKRHDRPCV
jgi:hypothetical protein